MRQSSRVMSLLILVLSATSVAAGHATAQPADMVLWHGHIITMDAHDAETQAIAIRHGQILAVGSDRHIRAHIGPHTRLINLHGRTVTPGLIDTHAHISSGGLARVVAIDLSDATSIAEIVRRVAARVQTLEPGEWLQGSGWDEGKLIDGRYVEAHDLDAVSATNPVWLEHTTGHYGVANHVALQRAGITADTLDPKAGTIERDRLGAPTGVLKESAKDLVTQHIPGATPAQRQAGILASLKLMHREGMTAAKDPAIEEEDWQAYVALATAHQLDAHICVLWRTEPDMASAHTLLQRLSDLPKPPHTVAGTNLMSCGVKIFMDGSGGARTAWMYEDWNQKRTSIDTGNQGYPLIDPNVFRAQVSLFHRAGLHIGTHAIGDRAIDTVVDAYDAVLTEQPLIGLRHSIIHANIPSDHALDVMLHLQQAYDSGFPESQAAFTWWIGDNYAGNFGVQRSARLNPFNSYQRRGIRFGGGSDYDVTPLPARFGLWASVAREAALGTFGAHPFGIEQSIDIHTALKSYTIWAAHQLFIEDQAGSLEVGKSADLAVWDRDPYRVPTDSLKEMRCELTVFRGEVVYRAATD